MAVRLGAMPPVEKPQMYTHLNAVYKAVTVARETGWSGWGMKVPLFEIEVAYRAFEFHGQLDEFIDLFRQCEREIDGRRNTKDSGNQDRPEASTGRG